MNDVTVSTHCNKDSVECSWHELFEYIGNEADVKEVTSSHHPFHKGGYRQRSRRPPWDYLTSETFYESALECTRISCHFYLKYISN